MCPTNEGCKNLAMISAAHSSPQPQFLFIVFQLPCPLWWGWQLVLVKRVRRNRTKAESWSAFKQQCHTPNSLRQCTQTWFFLSQLHLEIVMLTIAMTFPSFHPPDIVARTAARSYYPLGMFLSLPGEWTARTSGNLSPRCMVFEGCLPDSSEATAHCSLLISKPVS